MKRIMRFLVITLLFGAKSQMHAGILDVNVAMAKCKQFLEQMQNISCGNITGLTINISGGGSASFYPTVCDIVATMTASQRADCIAMAGKAGDIMTLSPDVKVRSLANLGQINAKKEVSNIAAPNNKEAIEVAFTTKQGLPVKFLILRQSFTRAQLEDLDTESEAGRKYKAELIEQFSKLPNQTAILTSFYRQLPGIENEWTELAGTQIDNPNDYQFAPNFDLRAYPNGLVVLETNKNKEDQTKHLFTLGDFQLKQVSEAINIKAVEKGNGIPVGGGKKLAPADI